VLSLDKLFSIHSIIVLLDFEKADKWKNEFINVKYVGAEFTAYLPLIR